MRCLNTKSIQNEKTKFNWKGLVQHGDYFLFDGSDIQKRYAMMMEGLNYVKNGDQATIGLGYWLMDVVHFSKDGEMAPLLNKLYSFDHGAKSENKEIMEAIEEVIVTKRENGGYSWLLTRSPKENIIDAIKEATAYGFRWKIKECHRQHFGN